jgi:hypothetical protein
MALQKSPYSLKVDELVFKKTKKLATIDKRTLNMEIEYILEKYIDEYEYKNGKLLHAESTPEDDKELPF